MVYKILYYLVNILLRIFYRKIHLIGLNNIPNNKPLFIVSNHPNGFMEPIIMACMFPIELHFLVRGDLFENKLLRPLLLSTNQIPIFRLKDGFASLRNNQKTISKTIEILKQNKAVLVFAEGSTDAKWQLRSLKKGMARMAFQCMDDNNDLDLNILPVGMTFSNGNLPCTEVIVNIGQTFSAKSFYVKNAVEQKIKMDELTEKTYQELQKLVIHLNEINDTNVVKSQWQAFNTPDKSNFLPRTTIGNTALFDTLKNSSTLLNKYPNDKLSRANSNLNNLSQALAQRKSMRNILLMPLALVGYFFWFVPIYFSKMLQHQLVKQLEFESSIRASTAAAIAILYFIVLSIIIFLLFGFKICFGIWVVMIFSGIALLYYKEKRAMLKI